MESDTEYLEMSEGSRANLMHKQAMDLFHSAMQSDFKEIYDIFHDECITNDSDSLDFLVNTSLQTVSEITNSDFEEDAIYAAYYVTQKLDATIPKENSDHLDKLKTEKLNLMLKLVNEFRDNITHSDIDREEYLLEKAGELCLSMNKTANLREIAKIYNTHLKLNASISLLKKAKDGKGLKELGDEMISWTVDGDPYSEIIQCYVSAKKFGCDVKFSDNNVKLLSSRLQHYRNENFEMTPKVALETAKLCAEESTNELLLLGMYASGKGIYTDALKAFSEADKESKGVCEKNSMLDNSFTPMLENALKKGNYEAAKKYVKLRNEYLTNDQYLQLRDAKREGGDLAGYKLMSDMIASNDRSHPGALTPAEDYVIIRDTIFNQLIQMKESAKEIPKTKISELRESMYHAKTKPFYEKKMLRMLGV